MCHGTGQGFRGERLAISGHQNGFAAPVRGVEYLGQHGSYRNEKPLAAGPSLVLGLNIKSLELTLDTIDQHAVGYALVPSQPCDIASTIDFAVQTAVRPLTMQK